MVVKIHIHFSDFFRVDPKILNEYGAFNVSLVNDLPLFIDPFLLFNSKKEEYQKLHNEIIKYLRFLRDKALYQSTVDEGLLERWYHFPEIRQTWLGYSLVGNYGRGLGRQFAVALHRNLNTIFAKFGEESITKGSHLEKLCLIKDGVGRDNISDFATNLIKEYLLKYTEEFAKKYLDASLTAETWIDKVRFNYLTESWEREKFTLPYYRNGDHYDYVILTPKDLLTKDNTWINASDLYNPDNFYSISQSIPNAQLRAEINNYFRLALLSIDNTTKKKAEIAEAIANIILKHPELLDGYIRFKEDTGEQATQSSDEKVEAARKLFIQQIQDFANILSENTSFYEQTTLSDTYEETHKRVSYLKDVIENKGGHNIFYINEKPVRRENDLHIMFRLVWYGTPSDVTSEANDGRGPVDFKISRGSGDKTLAEFKLASNSRLKQNLKKQVEIYQKASDAKYAVKVIIYFTQQEYYKVQRILRELQLLDSKDIVLIDARRDNKPSGSKAK